MKKVISVFLALLMVVTMFPLSVFAEDDILSYLTYEINFFGEVTIIDCDETISGDVVIPDTIEGYPVTTIGGHAFYNCRSLTSIIIPTNVAIIKRSAFWNCINLESVYIPNSVTTIGSNVFDCCENLTCIEVDETNSNYSSDKYGVLFNKNKSELIQYPIGNKRSEYTIPDSVISIGEEAFYNCKNIENLIIGNSITTIGKSAFKYCKKLKSAEIPHSVTTIDDSAFYGCSNLASITIPDSVTSIGSCAFSGCDMIESITIPDSVTSIADYAFARCSSLESITIPDSVTSIGSGAFEECRSLKSITIPDSVTSIGSHAFEKCSSFESITIPDSVTTIDNSAFYGCSNLASITIPDSVTSIGSCAFFGCDSLESITIPDSVTSIGSGAFEECRSLESITIPDGVISIGSDAFTCTGIKNIIIPDGVTIIEQNVFWKCSSLESITIPDSVTSIGGGAFSGCSSLKSIILPDGVTSIGSGAFEECYSLESITIPDGVTSIGHETFYKCYSLESITIPDSVTSIGFFAFEECCSLESITIPDGVTSIGDETFYNCIELTSVTIGGCVTSIGSRAFFGCDSLESITIPDGVTSIGDYAFYECRSLKSITIPDSVTHIGRNAFEYCSSLETVYYAGTEEQWNEIDGDGKQQLESKSKDFNFNSTGPDSAETDTPDGGSSGKDDNSEDSSEDFKEYTAHYGRLDSVEWTVVTNSNEEPWISKIVVEGKAYKVQKNLQKTTILEDYIEDDVAFATKNDEVVFIEPVAFIGDYSVHTYLKEDLSLTYYDGEIVESPGEAFNSEQKIDLYTYPCRNTRKYMSAVGDEGLLEYILSEIPEYEMSVQSIKLTLDNTDVISFDGKKTIEIPVNGQLVVGASIANTVPVTINRYHDMDINKKSEKINVNIEVNAKRNNTEIKWNGNQSILVRNGNYSKPEEKPNKPGGSSQTTADDYAARAAAELENISSAVSMDSKLKEIFTWEQLDAVGSMLLCEIAMAAAPKKTFSEILSEKIIEKIFSINTGLFGIRSDEVSLTVAVNSDYGEVKVKFTCDFQQYILSGSAFGYFGSINYEIVGGKGKSKLPKSFSKDGFAGTLTAIDMSAFCNAAYDLTLAELKNVYQQSWGNDANGAADIIFGTSVNKILSKTKYNSVSGMVWEALIYPGKQIMIECPVNVFVYNENNELVAAVENNEVTLDNPNVRITVNGDIKEIVVFDETYSITYEAIAEGSMRITVMEYGTSENLLSTTQINDIVLSPGRTYTQTINNEYFEDSDYSVTSSTGIIYKPDETVLSMHSHKPNGQRVAGEDAVCNDSGWEYCMCEICDEWYKNILEPTKLHTPGEWKVTIEAQVGAEGKEQQKCTVCGEVLEERIIPAIPDVSYTPGDVNGDGEITASDARIALRISAGLETLESANAVIDVVDINNDGEITASDARTILRKSAGLE